MEKTLDIPSTLSEQVSQLDEIEIAYRTLHPSVYMYNEQDSSTIEFPYDSLTNKYKHYLLACIVRVQLTEEEKLKYKYNPKGLSYTLYGTTELWSDLLKLNNAVSITDFEPDYVRVYSPSKFKSLLNECMINDADIEY